MTALKKIEPELQAVWQATLHCNRYSIDGVLHVVVKRNGKNRIVALNDLTPREIKELTDAAKP